MAWALPAGVHVAEAWGVTLVSDGADGLPAQATAPHWEPDLAAGQSVTIGYDGVRDDDATALDPNRFTLDGTGCGLVGPGRATASPPRSLPAPTASTSSRTARPLQRRAAPPGRIGPPISA